MPDDKLIDVTTAVNLAHDKIKNTLNTVVDTFTKTHFGNVKGSKEDVKKALTGKGPQICLILHQYLAPYDTAISVLKTDIEDYEQQTQQLTERAKTAEKKASDLETEVGKYRTQMEQKNTKIDEHLGKIQEVSNAFDTYRKTTHEKIADLETTLQDTQHDYSLIIDALALLPEHVLESRLDYVRQKAEIEATAENRKLYDDVYLVEIGTVIKYSEGVAGIQLIELEEPLEENDCLCIKGPEAELVLPVKSMKIDNKDVTQAEPSAYIELPVPSEVQKESIVYRMV